MQKWNIIYSGKVQKWLDKLPHDHLKRVVREMRRLEFSGNKLRLPQSKPLGGGLFELRERKLGYRLYYAFDKGHAVLLLCAGDKSTQPNDIKIAINQLREYKKEKALWKYLVF